MQEQYVREDVGQKHVQYVCEFMVEEAENCSSDTTTLYC